MGVAAVKSPYDALGQRLALGEARRVACRKHATAPSRQGCRVGARGPQSQSLAEGCRVIRGALSLGYFSLREQREVPRRRCANRAIGSNRGRRPLDHFNTWIPAFAGMTVKVDRALARTNRNMDSSFLWNDGAQNKKRKRKSPPRFHAAGFLLQQN
jgi:hypothetical protein